MYKLLLCLRYLKTRYIALASIISVTLGVATMIVVNSVMAGFSGEMRERIHGILADVVIETNSLDGVPDAEKHLQMVRQAVGDSIAGMTATVEVYGMLSFKYAGQWITRPVTLIGIKPQGKAEVGPLVDYLQSYQPLREGKEVVRPPLRSAEEPPGWTLTEEARKYRRRRLTQQQWFHEQQSGSSRATIPHGPAETDEPFQQPSQEPDATENASGDPKANATPSADPTEQASETPADSKSAKESPFENPFANSPLGAGPGEPYEEPFPAEADQQKPSTAPLEGRLYVGHGLISFPYDDKQSGEVKTMRMVRPGDDVKISTVTAGRPPEPVHFNATIVDVFKSGMSEYDSNLVFCNLGYLQKVRGMVDPSSGMRSITSIQLKLKDYRQADQVVERLKAAFPPGVYSIRTWEEKQGPLLAAVEVESAILNVLLFLIIAVAGFGILAIFFMIVVEKTRDIGILKALGASSRGVMSIFLSYGLALGAVGSGVGVSLGLVFVYYINEIESWVTWITGRKVFDERIYYFPEIPTRIDPLMVLWVAAGAMAIAVLASILPARRAARLHPVEALRYE